jgi:hypothetical protein
MSVNMRESEVSVGTQKLHYHGSLVTSFAMMDEACAIEASWREFAILRPQ